MARVVITAPADADAVEILARIAKEAGIESLRKFNERFEALYDRLADHPESCKTRPELGRYVRVGVVSPYLVIYRHVKRDEIVSVIRIVHGRRRISRELLRGAE